MPDWVLFSKAQCHLCEQAMTILHDLGLEYTVIDIMADAALLASYGQYIPVLRYQSQILVWPFTAYDVMSLAKESSK